jgi:hypothetical protein
LSGALTQLTVGRTPLPYTERSDGPFVFAGPALVSGAGSDLLSADASSTPESENYGLGPGPWSPEALDAARDEPEVAAGRVPGIIFATRQIPFGEEPITVP